MDDNKTALTDRLWLGISRAYKNNKTPFLAALLTGLLAHGFAFTNKLLNHDEIESLFGKGATVTSGRWGLELVKVLFPDWSMPWIYGLLSVVLLAISVCLIVRILGIQSKPLQALLGALMLAFPSVTGTFCFMFTSSAYALAFLFAVGSVYVYMFARKLRLPLSVLLLVAALGIYQAYISVAACLYMLLMIEDVLDKDASPVRIVLFGLKALAMMAVSIAVYYGITQLVFLVTGAEFNSYVTDNVNGSVSLLRRVRMAYDSFLYVFEFRNFALITTEASRYIHIILSALILLGLGAIAWRNRKPLNTALLLVLIALLPLAIECMYLIMSKESIHTLVIYSFTTVYMLAIIVIERLPGRAGRVYRDALSLLLAVVALANVYYANMVYLKLDLQYENASAFYTSLCAQIKDTDGFDENSRLAVIGQLDNLLYIPEELDTELMMGPAHDLVNIYSRENFFRYYLGFEIPFASEDELAMLENDSRVAAMSEYPYYGSVQKIDDYIVVKLG